MKRRLCDNGGSYTHHSMLRTAHKILLGHVISFVINKNSVTSYFPRSP